MKDGLPPARKDFMRHPLPEGSGRRNLLRLMCTRTRPPDGAALRHYVAKFSFPATPELVVRGSTAREADDVTGAIDPIPDILPDVLKDPRSGYFSQYLRYRV